MIWLGGLLLLTLVVVALQQYEVLVRSNRRLIQALNQQAQLEATLKENEARFRTLVETTSDWVWEVNEEAIYTYASPKVRDILGYEPDEVLGKTPFDLMPPEEAKRLTEWFTVIVATRSSIEQLENLNCHKDGHLVVLETSGVPIFDAQGHFRGYRGIDREITERKRIEAALRESERRLSTLINTLPGYVYRVANDPNYTPEFISEGVFGVTGYRQEEYLVDRTISCGQEIHPEDRQLVWQSVQQAVQTQQAYECTYRIITKMGEQKWVWERGHGIYIEDGSLRCLEGFVTDISAYKQAEALAEARLAELVQWQNRYEIAVQASGQCIYEWDARRDCITWGTNVQQVLGKANPELPVHFSEWLALIHPDDRNHFVATVKSCNQNQTNFFAEYRVRRDDGTHIWIEDQNRLLISPTGQLLGVIGCLKDISVAKRDEIIRQQTEAALQESRAELQAILNASLDAITLTNEQGAVLAYNNALLQRWGQPSEELLGKSAAEFLPEPIFRARLARIKRVMVTGEADHFLDEQEGLWFENTIAPVFEADGSIRKVAMFSRDITGRKRTEEKLLHDALHDTLTGLPNRTLLMDRIEHSLKRARRNPGYAFAVLLVDLDRFKLVNDTLGHLVGDQLLITIAELLQQCIRVTDTVARLGGDEFTILLDDLKSSTDAVAIAERIKKELKSPLLLEGNTVFSSASIGIVLSSSANYECAVDLLRDADIALYQAKERGKARYEIFNQTMYARVRQQVQIENELQQAISQQEFLVYYQPIISLVTGKLVGFEALVRWQHPRRGLVSAGDFIPVAEDTGLIVPIGLWVLQQACAQLSAWQSQFAAAQTLSISVNLSSKQLRELHLVEQVDQILAETGLEGSSLQLEMTESMLLENVDLATEILQHLQARQIQFSLDDFGTGYSSLSYLHRFPIDTLKIDRSFIRCITTDTEYRNENFEIVRAIIALAHALNLKVIAEGVETDYQYQQLQTLGCDLIQGYLIAKPLDQDAAAAMIINYSMLMPPKV